MLPYGSPSTPSWGALCCRSRAAHTGVTTVSYGGAVSPHHSSPQHSAPHHSRFHQLTLDEPTGSRPLVDVTFVVVDLETTGGSPASSGITEIGAVKVRGGQVLGEFATLVNPGAPIPPFIRVLTGITDAMVAPAPGIGAVLPTFLEFATGCVLVAHNAGFDVGFLAAASAKIGTSWPQFTVVDTVTLARRVLARGETPNCKLATLATLFRAATAPSHRALDDARATVDVLHGLIGRLGNVGVRSLEELQACSRHVSQAQRDKRHLAYGLPSAPGVYIFRAADNRPLYVGTSRDVRARVRNYFVSSQTRSRMGEMVAAAQHVEAVTCVHALEAQVRELRLIAAHNPPYNRRSKYPDRTWWIAVTSDAYPRLSLVRKTPADRDRALGPFRSQRAALAACDAIYEALPIRRCTTHLSPRRASPACALAEMGRCGAPCEHRESVPVYRGHIDELLAAFRDDPSGLIERILRRIEQRAHAERYEDAAALRDRLGHLVRALILCQSTRALTTVPQLMAAAPGARGWELAILRHGKLAAAGTAERAGQVRPAFDHLQMTAATITADSSTVGLNETVLLLSWLERPGTRLVRVDGAWSSPARGARRWERLLDKLLTQTSVPV